MYAGREVEEAPVAALFDRPAHPYTRGLMALDPALGAGRDRRRRLAEIPGIVPRLREPIIGCAFAPRCAFAVERCRVEAPPLRASRRRPSRVACCEAERVRVGSGRMTAPVLEVERAARSTSRSQRGLLQRRVARGAGRSTASASRSRRARRWAWSANPAAASRPSASSMLRLHRADRRPHPCSTARTSPLSTPAQMRPHRAARADGVPGPLRLAEPAPDGRRRSSASRWRISSIAGPASAESASPRCSHASGCAPTRCGAYPVRVLRRPAPAARHRAGAGGQPDADRRRRAGVGARRLGAGAGAEPADRPAGGVRPRLSVHLARPRRGRAHRPPHRGDVSRPHRRARRQATRCSPRRCIPTPRRCSRPRRCPTRAPSASASCSKATCRARSNPPPGCHFHTRCPYRVRPMPREAPPLKPSSADGRLVACHLRD